MVFSSFFPGKMKFEIKNFMIPCFDIFNQKFKPVFTSIKYYSNSQKISHFNLIQFPNNKNFPSILFEKKILLKNLFPRSIMLVLCYIGLCFKPKIKYRQREKKRKLELQENMKKKILKRTVKREIVGHDLFL